MTYLAITPKTYLVAKQKKKSTHKTKRKLSRKKGLNKPQHEEFCRQFVIDNNGTKAAERAKYSKKTAAQQASRLLSSVKIQDRIAGLKQKLQKSTHISAERVVEEFAHLALVDPAEAFDKNGYLLDVTSMPRNLRAAISSIDIVTETSGRGENKTTEYVKKIRFWDKNKALENLGKHLGIYTEDNKQKAESLAAFLKGVD